MATEKRLIDANDAEKFAREHILDAKERFLILDFLRECSTVDAVEVVRCWECKYGGMCSIRESMAVSDWNAYCFRGERRTDGNS